MTFGRGIRDSLRIGALALAALCVLPIATAMARNCEGLGSPYYNDSATGKCYFRSNTTMTWVNGANACAAVGGHLAVINDATEQARIQSAFAGNGDMYIGARDSVVEGTWVWEYGDLAGQTFYTGGAVVDGFYANWAAGEPNEDANDCAVFRSSNGGVWADGACGTARRYLCEMPACFDPVGEIGQIVFNASARVMQYCSGTKWEPMANVEYTPGGVAFDGTNSYLTISNDLVGNANTNRMTGSFWFRAANTGNSQLFIQSAQGGFQLYLSGSGQIVFDAYRQLPVGAGVRTLDMSTTTAGFNDGQWHHVAFSFDLSNAAMRHIYVDGVNQALTVNTYANNNIVFVDPFGYRIGSNGSAFYLNGALADFWIDIGNYMDLSLAANREKFRSAAGQPADLGADGSTPTGSAPIIYLGGAFSGWQTNKGTGGGFTIGGGISATASPNGLAYEDIKSGLIAHWRFDEGSGGSTYSDLSNTLPGTLTNMNLGTVWVNGRVGGGLDFDGTNDKVVVQPDPLINNFFGPLTWCAWVYPRVISGDFRTIVDKSTDAGGMNGFNFYLTSAGLLGYYSSRGDYKERGPALTINNWHFVCTTWDGTDGHAGINLYRNATLNSSGGTQGTGATLDDSSRALNFGGSGQGAAPFNGIIDDIRLYNRVLSTIEMRQLYLRGLEGGYYCSNPSRPPGTLIYNADSHVPDAILRRQPVARNGDR